MISKLESGKSFNDPSMKSFSPIGGDITSSNPNLLSILLNLVSSVAKIVLYPCFLKIAGRDLDKSVLRISARLKRIPVSLGYAPSKILVHDGNVRAIGVSALVNTVDSLATLSKYGVFATPPFFDIKSGRNESIPTMMILGFDVCGFTGVVMELSYAVIETIAITLMEASRIAGFSNINFLINELIENSNMAIEIVLKAAAKTLIVFGLEMITDSKCAYLEFGKKY